MKHSSRQQYFIQYKVSHVLHTGVSKQVQTSALPVIDDQPNLKPKWRTIHLQQRMVPFIWNQGMTKSILPHLKAIQNNYFSTRNRTRLVLEPSSVSMGICRGYQLTYQAISVAHASVLLYTLANEMKVSKIKKKYQKQNCIRQLWLIWIWTCHMLNAGLATPLLQHHTTLHHTTQPAWPNHYQIIVITVTLQSSPTLILYILMILNILKFDT